MLEPEQNDLAVFTEIVQMSQSDGWKMFMEFAQSIVDESHESVVGCISFDPMVRMGLDMRYQQRIAFKRAIENWVASAKRGQEEITESMRADLERMAAQGDSI